MKRTQAYFLLGVWGTLGLGFLITHYKTPEPGSRVFATGEISVELPALVVPRGETELSGQVIHPDGSAAEDCKICLYREELSPGVAEPLYWTFTDTAGQFSFQDLGNGAFQVALLTPTSAPTLLAVQLPVEGPVLWTLNPKIPLLDVLPELVRTSIAGRIHLPGQLNPTDHPLGEYEVCLVPGPGMEKLQGTVLRRVKTDPLGNFNFPQVAYGDYRLEVLPPWARGGTWPILATREFTAGKERIEASSLEIPLDMGALRGTVTSLKDYAIEGALVTVFPLAADGGPGPKGQFWPPAGTNAKGVFVIRDLPPGRYRFRVRAGGAAFQTQTVVRAGEVTELSIEPLDTSRRDTGEQE